MADDSPGHFYRGPEAELSVLRGASSNPEAFRVALLQLLDKTQEEVLLHDNMAVTVSIIAPNDSVDEDDDVEGDEEAAINRDITEAKGTLIVTSERILFWSQEESLVDYDLDISATVLLLHALQDEPQPGVYLQISIPAYSSKDDQFLQITVAPTIESSKAEHACKGLFDALTQLVNLHPIDDSETDDDGFFMDHRTISEKEESNGEATDEERSAMLHRLDEMLIVPPELERDTDVDVDENNTPNNDNEIGQFSDAEDDLL